MLTAAIPEDIWSARPCFIVHPGPVGDRGPSSLDWAIMGGAERWGVTVLQANAEMDAGDIWASAGFVMPACSKSSLYRTEVADAAVQAVLAAVARFESGHYRPEPLDYRRADVTGQCRPPCRQQDRRTGNVGREVTAQLVSAGVDVRAFARDTRAPRLVEGAEVAEGDLSVPGTLERALTGIEAVFLVWPLLSSDGAPAVLAAIAYTARRLVYLSSSGVNENTEQQTDPINQLHADMESLIEASGLEWTVLRANTIASNALGWAGQIRAGRIVRGPDIAPTAVIDPRDVAAVAARVLAEDGYPGAKLVLTGPQVLSRAEQVRMIAEAIGRPLRFEKVPLRVAREQMLADGRPPALVEALLASAETRPASDVVTSTVEEITGTAARTFHEWATDHADEFR